MTQYIDKSALVAEIERRIEELYEFLPDAGKVEKGMITISEACNTGKYTALESFKDYIDNLEVKGVDLEKDVRQIISLYYEGIKYYEDVIRKEREENGGSDLAIKIMDGVVDARELSIQYVIDKLKAQKGE